MNIGSLDWFDWCRAANYQLAHSPVLPVLISVYGLMMETSEVKLCLLSDQLKLQWHQEASVM